MGCSHDVGLCADRMYTMSPSNISQPLPLEPHTHYLDVLKLYKYVQKYAHFSYLPRFSFAMYHFVEYELSYYFSRDVTLFINEALKLFRKLIRRTVCCRPSYMCLLYLLFTQSSKYEKPKHVVGCTGMVKMIIAKPKTTEYYQLHYVSFSQSKFHNKPARVNLP